MNLILLIVIIGLYCFFVHLNYIWFKELMDKEKDRKFAHRFWFYIASGPILASFVIYKKIQKYRRRRALVKEIKKQLPSLLKQYDITVLDD